MKKKSICTLIFIFLVHFLPAESNEKAIRQTEWQQRVNHSIQVELIYVNNKAKLIASQTIEYINNSPDTLAYIMLHLWPNAYKNNNTPFAEQQARQGKKDFLLPTAQKGHIVLSNIKANNKEIRASGLEGEIATVVLNSPLLPGEKVLLTMDFVVHVPKLYSRMGATKDFIAATQWYPKPAVYDVNGWNTMSYVDQGEFYSEFGDYNVKITTPYDFLVASTGELQTETELEYLTILEKYFAKKLTNKKFTLHEDDRPINPWKEKRTVEYKQNNVHDFAWFASTQFSVLGKKTTLRNGKEIYTRVFSYIKRPNDENLDYIDKTLKYYSERVGDYPYDFCTLVVGPLEAGGGMEYPTITICASDDFETILHEVGHNWFYGILGSNERQHPWMDESINSYYENEYFTSELNRVETAVILLSKGKKTSEYLDLFPDKYLDLNVRRLGESQAGNIPSEDYNSMSYYTVVYGRVAHYFNYLADFMGRDKFDTAMQFYYETWKFRHPLPGDLQEALEKSSGLNLNWFFKELLPDVKGTDFSINFIKRLSQDSLLVSLTNKTGILIPLAYGFLGENNILVGCDFIAPFSKDTILLIGLDVFEKIIDFRLDPFHYIPENNRRNNIVEVFDLDKVSKSRSRFNFKLSPMVENPYFKDIFINPALNYNMYSSWGIGVSVFNRLFPLRNFEFDINTYFTTGTRNIIGNGGIAWNRRFYDKEIYRIKFGLEAQRYDYRPNGANNTFNKFNPFVTFYFKHRGKASEQIQKSLRMEYFGIFSDKREYSIYNEIRDTTFVFPFGPNTRMDVLKFTYSYANKHGLTPQRYFVILEGGNTGVGNSASNAQYGKVDFRYRFEYNYKGFQRKFRADFNAGAFLYRSDNLSGIFQFRGSGNTGVFDYLFNETMLGRSQSIGQGTWGQQLVTTGGDMRINAFSFVSDRYVSAKFESSLPIIRYLRVYSDFAINLREPSKVYWAGGLSIVGWDDILEVYLPLVYGENFDDFFELNNFGFRRRIAFKLDLNFFYPRKNIEVFRPLFGF